MTSFSDRERLHRWRQFLNAISPDIDPRSLRLMEEMRLVGQALRRIGENSLAAAGLSYAQYRLLLDLYLADKIDEKPNLNPSEISDHLGSSRNTISALIRSLEDSGKVRRVLDSKDRRKFNISLTDEGVQVIEKNARAHVRSISRVFAALTPEEQERLSQLLIKLGRSLDSPSDDNKEEPDPGYKAHGSFH